MDLHLQLEMPLEALLFRHPAAAASSLWACLVVLAAAFGLWRIRSASVASRPDNPEAGVHPDKTQFQRQPPSPQSHPLPEAPEKSQSEAGRSPRHVAVGGEGPCVASSRKKILFEARGCYELDDEEDDHHRGGAVEREDYCYHQEEDREEQRKTWGPDGFGVVCGGRGWGAERWRGDLGWYLHQDVAALNGRVVRLWEDEKRLLRRRRWVEAAW